MKCRYAFLIKLDLMFSMWFLFSFLWKEFQYLQILNYLSICPNHLKDTSYVYYFKWSYIGKHSHQIENTLSKLCKEFCKENFNIKLVFNSFKIKNYFTYKDPVPDDLKSFLV